MPEDLDVLARSRYERRARTRRDRLRLATSAILAAIVAATVVLLLGCATLGRVVECGITCPENSSCKPVGEGAFIDKQACVCRFGPTPAGTWRPSTGNPCPPPSPSPTTKALR